METKGFYHVCSEGLDKAMIFRNPQEFIAGMNYVAVCAVKYNVKILCFCLMGNHFHFILNGVYDDCKKFGEGYKVICSMLMSRQQGSCQAMKGVEVQLKKINDRTYLESAIAYVLRNPLAAGYKIMPHQYKWGSGDMYFRASYIPSGTKAEDFPVKKLAQIIGSKQTIPGEYIIDDSGMVSPLNYIDYHTVEQVFGHPARLSGLLATKKETEFELFLGIADTYNPDIEELRASVYELINIEFGVKAISQLDIEQKIRLCSLMRKNFRASKKQIAVITRLNMETINKII